MNSNKTPRIHKRFYRNLRKFYQNENLVTLHTEAYLNAGLFSLNIWVLPLCFVQVTVTCCGYSRSRPLPKQLKRNTAHRFPLYLYPRVHLQHKIIQNLFPDHSSIENTNLYHSSLISSCRSKKFFGRFDERAPKQKKINKWCMTNILNLLLNQILQNQNSNVWQSILVRDFVIYWILKICDCQEVMPILADTKFPVAKHISGDPGENVSFQSNIRTHIHTYTFLTQL